MTRRLSAPRRLLSQICTALLAGTLLGCTASTEYPPALHYAPRTDLLFIKEPGVEERTLPAPGDLDSSIARASTLTGAAAVDPTRLSAAERKELQTALRDVFGTPAAPTVEPKDEEPRADYDSHLGRALQTFRVREDALEKLQLDPQSLRKGSELYRKHCMHCHGVSGDGRGPTGPWLHPHPRDYRKGEFKFISTHLSVAATQKPRRDDLLRTLEKGIEGTSMPAFGLLPARELQLLTSYLIHLSLRGQVEFNTIETILSNPGSLEDSSIRTHVLQRAAFFLAQWANVNALEANKPPAYPYDPADKAELAESIRRGHALFIGKGICITCHFDYGRQSAYKYDAWGTLVRPRDLTQPTYRGGRRPLDFYWRISSGIGPSKMPKLDGASDKEFWDVINFVQNLPYPAMLPDDIRQKVYGASETRKAPVASADR